MNPRQAHRGSVLLETLVLLPVFLLLVFGVLDFARLLWTDLVLRHALAETGRYAMVHGSAAPTPASLADLRNVYLAASRSIDEAQLTLQSIPDWDTASAPGAQLRLEASYEFQFLWDFLPAPSVTLTHEVLVDVTQ
ncbi:MAG: hypothetical protein FGM43_01285 [Sinobacteraceae bacterium]|nr:hypothetical protein [Nevskiaceae bacterium]